MTERDIQDLLYAYRSEHVVVVPNIRMPWGESDLLSVTRAGYVFDHDIKVSRADFQRDFSQRSATKWTKHYQFGQSATAAKPLPNHFVFVTPANLITVDEVPGYAGLFWLDGGQIVPVKAPPKLHPGKIDQATMQQLARSLMFKYWNVRRHCADIDEVVQLVEPRAG